MSDPRLPHSTCKALMCSTGDLLLHGSLFEPDWISWVMGESCAVTCVEGYQAANETSGTLTCVYEEIAGDVVLEVAVTKTGVCHERRDILSQGSCGTTGTEGHEADGGISTTSWQFFVR